MPAGNPFLRLQKRFGFDLRGRSATVRHPKRFELILRPCRALFGRHGRQAARKRRAADREDYMNTFAAGAAVWRLSAGMAPAQDLKFPVGEGAFNWDSYKAYDEATNLDGQTLTIFGPWRGEDQVLVESMLAYFTAASGVTVNYSSSENYEQQIVIDTQAGSPPDIAILPQPGLIADLAKQGL
jgi:hypothetical protein